MSVYCAIGDIHGKKDLLRILLRNIENYKVDKVIFLGDYIDRGEDSKNVLDQLISYDKKSVTLMGNHELMMLKSYAKRDYSGMSSWLFNGGKRTIESFGYYNLSDFFRNLDTKYIDFLKQLKIIHTETITTDKEKQLVFAHAGVTEEVILDDVRNITGKSLIDNREMIAKTDIPLWTREDFFEMPAPYFNGNIVIHGHTPTHNLRKYFIDSDLYTTITTNDIMQNFAPIIRHDFYGKTLSIAIDSGVAFGGMLTALRIDDENFEITKKGTFLNVHFHFAFYVEHFPQVKVISWRLRM